MRRLLLAWLFALGLLIPQQSFSAAFINDQHGDALATVSYAFSATMSIGNTGVLVIGCGSGLCASLGVSDNGANTWTLQAGASNGGVLATYTCLNATGNATTITITTTLESLNVNLLRYSGITSIGNTNSATATSTNPSVSVTLQESNNFIAGGYTTNGTPGTVTAQNGTIRSNAFNSAQASLIQTSIDNTSASIGSLAISATQTNSTNWWAGVVELRASAASTSGSYDDEDESEE